jgi:hypothetical protein
MAKKKKRKPQPPAAPDEPPAVIAATVGWMLAVLTTICCMVVAAGVWGLAREGAADNVLLFARFMHFSAVVTSLVSLALLAVVLKMRSEPPPRSIIAVALIAAAVPLVAIFW